MDNYNNFSLIKLPFLSLGQLEQMFAVHRDVCDRLLCFTSERKMRTNKLERKIICFPAAAPLDVITTNVRSTLAFSHLVAGRLDVICFAQMYNESFRFVALITAEDKHHFSHRSHSSFISLCAVDRKSAAVKWSKKKQEILLNSSLR